MRLSNINKQNTKDILDMKIAFITGFFFQEGGAQVQRIILQTDLPN